MLRELTENEISAFIVQLIIDNPESRGAGTTWYNIDTKSVEYWDGSSRFKIMLNYFKGDNVCHGDPKHQAILRALRNI